MPFLKTPHGNIYYSVRGEGTPVVLIRGMTYTAEHWLGFDRKMAEDFCTIVVDHRGIGKTTLKAHPAMTVEDMADDVIQVLDHMNIARAHFFGISLGGMVTLSVGLRHPERALSLTVINSSVGGTRQLRVNPIAILKSAARVYSREKQETTLLPYLFHGFPLETSAAKKTKSQWLKLAEGKKFPLAASIYQAIAALRFNQPEELKTLKVPTLIVSAQNDRFVPMKNSQKLHQAIPQSKLVKIANAGHELTLDQPDQLIQTFKEFVSQKKVIARQKNDTKKQDLPGADDE